MSSLYFIDTLLNIWVFAFIGFLAWLYFKKDGKGHNDCNQVDDGNL